MEGTPLKELPGIPWEEIETSDVRSAARTGGNQGQHEATTQQAHKGRHWEKPWCTAHKFDSFHMICALET